MRPQHLARIIFVALSVSIAGPTWGHGEDGGHPAGNGGHPGGGGGGGGHQGGGAPHVQAPHGGGHNEFNPGREGGTEPRFNQPSDHKSGSESGQFGDVHGGSGAHGHYSQASAHGGEQRNAEHEENSGKAEHEKSEHGHAETEKNSKNQSRKSAKEEHHAGQARGGKNGEHEQASFAGPNKNERNPRPVGRPTANTKPQFSKTRGEALHWKNATNVPRAGKKGVGRAGIIDPGGYIRNPGGRKTVINANYAHRQLSSIPNYRSVFDHNNRYRSTNWNQTPYHWRPQLQSGSNLGWYNNYWWNGAGYPGNYFAPQTFCPTPWMFYPAFGQFWCPGSGYCNYLPYNYQQPISIAIQEVVPQYDNYGNIIGYVPETFYYNAFWDPNAQSYGYYDYRGQFHVVSYPWLNSWNE